MYNPKNQQSEKIVAIGLNPLGFLQEDQSIDWFVQSITVDRTVVQAGTSETEKFVEPQADAAIFGHFLRPYR